MYWLTYLVIQIAPDSVVVEFDDCLLKAFHNLHGRLIGTAGLEVDEGNSEIICLNGGIVRHGAIQNR